MKERNMSEVLEKGLEQLIKELSAKAGNDELHVEFMRMAGITCNCPDNLEMIEDLCPSCKSEYNSFCDEREVA